jgi:hypothetical protein
MSEPADRPKSSAPDVVISVADIPHAPFVFYDGAPSFGYVNGVINITLAAGRSWVGSDGKIVNDHVVTAYLRGNVVAAINLRDSLDKAILLAQQTPGPAN